MKMLKRIGCTWLLLSFAGLTLYFAFYAAFESKDFSRPIVLAVVAFALTISILLTLDDSQVANGEKLENMTFAGLGYVLPVKRKPLLAALGLTLFAMVLTVYYLSKLMGVTFETEGSSLTVKLPGQTIHYIPIHSQQGWQNTGIELKAGQKVQYSITGYVSPGYLQDIDIRSEQLRKYKLGQITDEQLQDESPKPKWKFTGPEGYDWSDPNGEWYRKMTEQDRKDCDQNYREGKINEEARKKCEARATKHFNDDTGLTVQGLPHNRVVGITLRRDKKPNDPSNGKPGYNYQEDKDKAQLIEFEVDLGQRKMEATTKQAGMLWVVINDSEAYRWDNAGLYFMKLVIP